MCLFPPSLGSSLIIYLLSLDKTLSWFLSRTLSSLDEDLHILAVPKMCKLSLC